MASPGLKYNPPESVQGFLQSESFISLIVGPVGSTKTTAGIIKIAYMAKQMATCKDGIRRSRAIWVRNTKEQLRDTSIPDFLKWFPDGVAGTFAKTNSNFLLKFSDVECEVLFRGLDDANDVRRLLSLQASFAIFDEFREINRDIYEVMQGRLGRYPDGMMVPHRPEWGYDKKGDPIQGCVTDDGKQNKHLWGMTNAPDVDSFWEELLTNPPSNVEVFFQPSGLSEEADWVQYLPADYYDNLAEGKTADWIDVYINGRFGKSLAGQPVFRAFKYEFHVAKQPLLPIRASENPLASSQYPLLIGADFGLTPAAVVGQIDPRGRLLIMSTLTSEGMGALRFIREKLKPHLARKFPGIPQLVIGDPAGVQRSQTDERSVFDIFKQEGFRIIAARTNAIPGRIAAVDNWLTRVVDGGAAVLLDPVDCKPLVVALRGGYRFKINAKGETAEQPDKNMHSHIADACFVAGTPVATPTGEVAIESLRPGDLVLTPIGPRKVLHQWQSSPRSPVGRTLLGNGRSVVSTGNHPLFVEGRGFLPIDTVQYTHKGIFLEQPCDKSTPSRPSTESAITVSPAGNTVRINTPLLKLAPAIAQQYQWCGHEPVYALAVEDCPMYFAAGVLVHNCQYLCLHADPGIGGGGLYIAGRKKVKKVAFTY